MGCSAFSSTPVADIVDVSFHSPYSGKIDIPAAFPNMVRYGDRVGTAIDAGRFSER